MKASEIIENFAKKEGMDPRVVLGLCAHFIKNKQGFLLSKNDTVVMFIEIAPKTFETHIATEDTPITVMKSMLDLYKRIKKLKVKKIYGRATNFEIVAILRKVATREGGTLEVSDISDYNWMITL